MPPHLATPPVRSHHRDRHRRLAHLPTLDDKRVCLSRLPFLVLWAFTAQGCRHALLMMAQERKQPDPMAWRIPERKGF